MTRLGLVCGLASEARIAARAGLRVACRGSDPDRAYRAALGLTEQGVGALVSFGVAGGLDPGMASGCLLIAAEVVAGTELWTGPVAWRDRVVARLPGARVGAVAGAPALVATVAAKRTLRQATGALAVDLESESVARAATAAGVPFLIVRAIADPAWREVPAEAAGMIDSRGAVNLARVAAALLGRPGLVAPLARMARDMRRALGGLRIAAAVLAAEPSP